MGTEYAWVTARVIGPDGRPRAGRVIFQPLYDAWTGTLGSGPVVIAGWTSATLDDDGRMTTADGPGMRLIAPESLPEGVHNYRVTLDSPRDPRSPREYRARILAGTTVDLSDVLMDRAVEALSRPGTHAVGDGFIEADASRDVVEIEDGLLTWRNDG